MKHEISSKELSGAEIQYYRLEPQYWQDILLRFKDTGLRCVNTYTPWSIHLTGEPNGKNPAGILDFEGKTDPKRNLLGFMDLIEKHDLSLSVRCGPFCCNEMVHGGYPQSLVMGDPNMMVWDYQNRTTQGYWTPKKEGSQPSYLHPEYLQWCKKWVDEVDKIVKPRLRSNGGYITMMNLDNEVSYIIQDGFLSSDYNPVNVKPGGFYHQFLTKKYGSAANLPYDTNYSSIDQVPAPRSIPDEIDCDLAYYIDWCDFKQWAMTEYICRLREMHESNGIKDVIFTTNLNPHRPEGVPTRIPAFAEAAQGPVGYDFYRGTFMSYSGYHSMARVLKLMNATLDYTWSPEFMAGTWEKLLTSRVSDDHMRFMARCALAHGCKAISWFVFHDRDCWGDSPVSSHGHVRPSLEVLRETCELIHDKITDWDKLKPIGDAAVIYDLVQHQHTYLGDPSPCDDGNLHIGKPLIAGTKAGIASAEYEGLFRLIEQAGAQANIVDIIHDPKALNEYKLVFLPGSPVIESAVNETILKFIEQGGTLILSGSWPVVNEHGKEINFLGIKKPDQTQPTNTITIGKGKLIWHVEYIAQEKSEHENLTAVDFVSSLIDEHAPDPAVRIKPAEQVKWVDWLENGQGQCTQPRNLGSAVLHENEKTTILFVMNHYVEAARFNLTFSRAKYKKLTDLSTSQTIDIHKNKATVDIDRKSCAIYKVLLR